MEDLTGKQEAFCLAYIETIARQRQDCGKIDRATKRSG